MKQLLWPCAAGLSLACYSYVPVRLETVAPGTAMRALISTEAQVALRDSLGLRQQRIQGTLVDQKGDRVLLAIRSDGGEGRAEPHALYQRVALAPRDLLEVEVKRPARGRTVGLVGALAAVATVSVIQALKKGNPGTAGSPGGGPPE